MIVSPVACTFNLRVISSVFIKNIFVFDEFIGNFALYRFDDRTRYVAFEFTFSHDARPETDVLNRNRHETEIYYRNILFEIHF